MKRKFNQQEVQQLIAADLSSLQFGNGWSLRTKLQWGRQGQDNLSDLDALPPEYMNTDELITRFLETKNEWNQVFVNYIRDFGLAALVAAINIPNNIPHVFFEGRDADVVTVHELYVDSTTRLISVTVKT